MTTRTLTIEVGFDPDVTDVDAVGVAVDNLLETAMSTPGILDEYGNPDIGQTYVQHERVPLLMKYVATGEDDVLDNDAFLGTVADRIWSDMPGFNQPAASVIEDSKELFDKITGASYHGFGFRQILINDPEALKAARILVDALKKHGAKGLE
jgi:hypothetical protein